MDNAASLLPGRNPSGTSVAGDYSILPAMGSTSGANPVLPPTNLPSGAPATNGYDPTSVVPTFGANTGPYSPSHLAGAAVPGSSNPMAPGTGFGSTTKRQQGRTQGELVDMYGEGLGNMLYQFLQGGAGFNQKAIDNLFAALQPGIERGTESLMEQFSTSGNRFGSGAQIGLADYLSQVQLNEGQLETQMYEQSIQDYLATLMGTASTSHTDKVNSPSTLEKILSPITNLVSPMAGAASAAGVGGSAGTILDIIASLCWVAAELYGGWYAPETVSIRTWLLNTWYMTPFVWLYRKFGKQWAEVIKTHRFARKITKKLFDAFLEASRGNS